MTDISQELMTPNEAAKWFRRSTSWLRHQTDIVRVAGPGGQPLYHVDVCRAYTLGKMCGLEGAELRRIQIEALAAACRLLRVKAWDALVARVIHEPQPVADYNDAATGIAPD